MGQNSTLEVNSTTTANWSFTKVLTIHLVKNKVFSIDGVGKNRRHIQKNKIGPLSFSMYEKHLRNFETAWKKIREIQDTRMGVF